ncbi:caspase family protein [Streptomyces aureus]
MTAATDGARPDGQEPRRYLIATAVSRYPKRPDWDRPGRVQARERIIDLFTRQLGYRHESALGINPTADQLRDHLRAFCSSAERREDDLVVVYVSGHGEVLDDGGKHALMMSDTDPADLSHTSLPTADLVRVVRGSRFRRLLLILDTCCSGHGANEGVATALAGLGTQWPPGTAGAELVIMSSAQPDQQAVAGVFPYLLRQAVNSVVTTGNSPDPLSVSAAVQHMNDHPGRAAYHHIGLTLLGPTGEAPGFLTVPRHGERDAGQGPGRPISQWSPHDLEVHPAGITPSVEAGSGKHKLSGYVPRDHDRVLSELVRSAGQGDSGMAVLVGSSSTGKTRACWEAVQPLSEKGWRLWHPFDPTRATAALEELHRVGPRTVVWLNETQHYLGDPRSGEEIAAALHTLLVDPGRGPVLVLGTLWPEYARRYAALPEPGAPDPHSRTRALLTGRTLTVPDTFDTAALAAARGLAEEGDGLLSDALTRASASGRLAQDLAGAPALLRCYEHGTPAARAVLEAAMDSRRLGHGPLLPYGLLAEGAEGCLTDEDWDALADDWLEAAMAYLTAPVTGAQGALVRRRPRGRGLPATADGLPRYRLADYLEQHGRRTRQEQPVSGALWQALIGYGDETGFLALGEAAQNRGLFRIAAQFYARADGGAENLARLLDDCGRHEEARPWWIRRATEVGGGSALSHVARSVSDGTADQAEEILEWWWEETSKDPSQGPALSSLIRRLGPETEPRALLWWRRAAEQGHSEARRTYGDHLERTEGPEAVLAWHEDQCTNNRWHRHTAADLHVQEGRTREAVALLADSAEDDVDTHLKLGKLLLDCGRDDEAVEWLIKAARDLPGYTGRSAVQTLFDAGKDEAALESLVAATDRNGKVAAVAAQLLEGADRKAKAVDWWRLAASTDDPDSWDLLQYARSLAEIGELPEAVLWYQRSIEAGERRTFGAVQPWEEQLLASQGKSAADLTRWRLTYAATTELLGKPLRRWSAPLEDKLAWLFELVDRGHPTAMTYAISRLCDAGREQEALEWALERAERGDDRAPREVADLYESAGDLDQALLWWERSAQETSFGRAGHSAGGRALRDAGRLQEAVPWFRRATEAGDVDLLWSTVELYERLDRCGEALTWLWQLAVRGWPFCVRLTADVLQRSGNDHEARQLRLYGWEPDGSTAPAWTAPSPG